MQKRFDAHNAKAAYWNDRAGPPQRKFAELQQELTELEREQESVERLRTDLNDDVAAWNDGRPDQ